MLRIQMQSWGRPPDLRGYPRTRPRQLKSASSKPSKPTRASAAVQGDRPTKNANLPILGNQVTLGCHPEPPATAFLRFRPSYNRLMRRVSLLALSLAGALCAQEPKKPPEQQPKEQQDQKPPEEDESLKPKEYSFNPLEAEHDLQIGTYYFKKGNLKAAMNRFREATRWNPNYAEAFLRLGDTEEKLKDKQAAREAYTKYLELSPDGKEAESVKKKLAGKR